MLLDIRLEVAGFCLPIVCAVADAAG